LDFYAVGAEKSAVWRMRSRVFHHSMGMKMNKAKLKLNSIREQNGYVLACGCRALTYDFCADVLAYNGEDEFYMLLTHAGAAHRCTNRTSQPSL
jgi:hypothetical protein